MKKKSNPLPDLYIDAISQALEQRRRHLGLSQDQLAERTGLHRTYISLIERRSATFSIKIYMRLAISLGLDPAELMRSAESIVNSRPASKGEAEHPEAV